MGIKTTHLLSDDPASEDDFGTHLKIAGAIRDEILNAPSGRSIALVGDWGSGKSTVVELLKKQISGTQTHLFIYDAWAHQGDSLRRAFLDDLIVSLDGKLADEKLAAISEKIWNRTETTTTIKEPVLRRHAKALLLSLALVPLGMKLFDIPSSASFGDSIFLCRNIFAYLFLLAPAILAGVFGLINTTNCGKLKDFFFGESHKESQFSVLNFFFEKVQGQIERKHIKTPVDSIQAFRDIFSELLDLVSSKDKNLRVVLILDNIDRIPSEQARDFWSTMQTFFGDGGGLRKPKTKKYWLLAPFSVEALSFIFREGVSASSDAKDQQIQARAKAKSYVDKTFGLTFYVPPPILTNWRKYLLAKLHTSFPEHGDGELVAVRDAFDFARAATTITPREMKLFVNSLVSLYRQRGEDISLPVIAIYALHREEIVGTEIGEQLISLRERRLIDDADWRIPMAALHFGVSQESATQLLLQEPIISALRAGSKNDLKSLEDRPGFVDVFRRIAAGELESQEAEDGINLAQFSATVGSLDGASAPDLSGIWRDLRERLKNIKHWSGLPVSAADGITVALSHTPEFEKPALCRAIASSLSTAALAEPAGDYQRANGIASNWLATARAVADARNTSDAFEISFPDGGRLKLELLQQLAELDASVEYKKFFKTGISAEDLGKTVADEIAGGKFPRSQPQVVSLISKLKIEIQWSPIVKACAERLRVNDLGANETKSLVSLLIAMNTIGSFAEAGATLKDLSIKGNLSHLFQQHRKDAAVSACLLEAILLFNSAFERPQQIEQSSNGDNVLNGLIDAEKFDPAFLKSLANAVTTTAAGSKLFISGAQNSKIGKLTAAVIGEMVRESYQFGIAAQTVVDLQEFLTRHADLNPIGNFVARVSEVDEVLSLLSNQPFDVNRSQLYRATLDIAFERQTDGYLKYLEEGLSKLERNAWEEGLRADNGASFELLLLATRFHEGQPDFELETPARDAALAMIRQVGRGELAPSDDLRNRLTRFFVLLTDSLRVSLIRDVIDDMSGSTNPDYLTRLVEIAGDHVALDDIHDPDRLVRRIFAPIVNQPTERSALWMATVVSLRVEFFRSMPEETKTEFGWRLRTSLQAEGLSASIVESLTNTAGLLGIDLSVEEQNEENSIPE